MLKTLRAINTDFRAALDAFWKDYIFSFDPTEAYNMDNAESVLRHNKAILNQVLEMRGSARRIKGILDTPPLKSLTEKES
ncbi:hypothetical protein ES707_09604 [subsurface metagenome]